MKRRFPDHVSEYRDRHGKYRLRYRRTGCKTYNFKHAYGTKEFELELTACRAGTKIKIEPGAENVIPGTIADLVARFYQSGTFKAGNAMTQRKNRGILDTFKAAHAAKTVTNIQFEHLDAIIARKAEKHPPAAANLRKQLKRLFKHAVKLRMRADNPADLTAPVRGKKGAGYHSWSEVEIAQFRGYHPLGTKPRLALELILWTDQRKGDAIALGPKDIINGRLAIDQDKTGKILHIKVAPQLTDAIKAMPVTGTDTFLVTSYGKPFSPAGFGIRFREWCDKAGLEHCTAHGLRKAGARRAADLGATQQELKALGGWSNDREVALYVERANQAALADRTIDTVSAWEMANLDPRNWLTKE